MSGADVFALAVAAVLFVYLLYALVRAERF
jgi:K+-transporting ATPase KdpF subunit